MDPNETLKEMLNLARTLQKEDIERTQTQSTCPPKFAEEDALRLAELVLALDGWLRADGGGMDGFLPDRWAFEKSGNSVVIARGLLIEIRDECLGKGQPGFMDPDGAVILSYAIRYLSFKMEGKPYERPTD